MNLSIQAFGHSLFEEPKQDWTVCTLNGHIINKQLHAIDSYSPTCRDGTKWVSNQSTLHMSLDLFWALYTAVNMHLP